jgi:putative FmdB family regulatory protein
MPLYEYHCHGCDAKIELLIRGDEQPQCPECGSKRLEKQFSVPAAAHVAGNSLPMAGGCGRPQCGTGGCMSGE